MPSNRTSPEMAETEYISGIVQAKLNGQGTNWSMIKLKPALTHQNSPAKTHTSSAGKNNMIISYKNGNQPLQTVSRGVTIF